MKNHLPFKITLFFLPILMATLNAFAQTVDENNVYNGKKATSIGQTGSSYYGQSFYANVKVMTKFGVFLSKNNSEGQVVLAVAEDNGSGFPDVANPLYQGLLINPSASGDWYYESNLNIPLSIGKKYWIIIDGYNNPGASGNSSVGLSDNFTDTGENMIYTNGDGSSPWTTYYFNTIAIYTEGFNSTINVNNNWSHSCVESVGASGSNYYAQSFYADVSTLTEFGVYAAQKDPEGQFALSIVGRNDDGMPNTSNPIYKGSLKKPSATGGWLYESGLNIPLVIGKKYFIVIDGYNNPGATGTARIGISENQTNSEECMFYSNYGGTGTWATLPGNTLAIYVAGLKSAIIDEFNGYNGTSAFSIGNTGSKFYAQSFYAGVDTITSFGVVLNEYAPQGEVVLSIAANDGYGNPNVSAPLYRGKIKNPSPTASWFFETELHIPVKVGTKYWVIIDGTNNRGASGCSGVGCSSGHTDTNENMIFSNSPDGSTWTEYPFYTIALFVAGDRKNIVDENIGFQDYFLNSVGKTGSTFYAQSFYASVDTITAFGVVLKENEAEGQVVLALAADNGSDRPDMNNLLYQSPLRNPHPTATWINELGLNIHVTIGKKYWVVIDGYENKGATGNSSIGVSSEFTDTGESMLYNNSDGNSDWVPYPGLNLSIYVDGKTTVMKDEHTTFNDSFISQVGASGSNFYAQSFYADVNAITKFGVILAKTVANGQVKLAIARDNGSGKPDLFSPLYQGTLISPSSSPKWYYETGINIPVNIGQKYYVLIDGYMNFGATGSSKVGASNDFTDTGESMMYCNDFSSGYWCQLNSLQLAINVEGLRTSITLSDTTINSGSNACFDATGNIVITANTDLVKFKYGSSTEIIAGNSIVFLPGFHSENGSFMHASITENANYCSISPLYVVNPDDFKSAQLSSTQPINEISDQQQTVLVYPNPSNGQFSLECKNITNGSCIRIYNLLGAKVYQSFTNDQSSQEIDLSGIKKGIYLIKITDQDKVFTKKIMIN